jgi:hypothetical protein
MKTKIILIIFTLICTSFFLKKEVKEEVKFKLIEKYFYKGAYDVGLQIINNTDNDYYFPIDKSEESLLCMKHYSTNEKLSLLYLDNFILNKKNDTLNLVEKFTSAHISPLNKFYYKHFKKVCDKSNGIEELVIVRSRKSKIIRIPISLWFDVGFSDDIYTVENYDKLDNNYLMFLHYKKKERSLLNKFFDTNILDSLEKKNINLYQKEIVSNGLRLSKYPSNIFLNKK